MGLDQTYRGRAGAPVQGCSGRVGVVVFGPFCFWWVVSVWVVGWAFLVCWRPFVLVDFAFGFCSSAFPWVLLPLLLGGLIMGSLARCCVYWLPLLLSC